MNNPVKAVTVLAAAAGTDIAINKAAPKRATGNYPTPIKVGVTVAASVASLFVAAFLERKLGLTD